MEEAATESGERVKQLHGCLKLASFDCVDRGVSALLQVASCQVATDETDLQLTSESTP